MMLDKELLEKIEKTTFTDYEGYEVVSGDEDKKYVTNEHMETMLEDLLYEISKRDEEIEELKED